MMYLLYSLNVNVLYIAMTTDHHGTAQWRGLVVLVRFPDDFVYAQLLVVCDQYADSRVSSGRIQSVYELVIGPIHCQSQRSCILLDHGIHCRVDHHFGRHGV